MPVQPGERREMLLVGEARDAVIWLRIEMRLHNAAFGERAKHRELSLALAAFFRARRYRPRQMVHKRGDEDRLAGARQAGDAKPQAPAREKVGDALGGDARFEQQIG